MRAKVNSRRLRVLFIDDVDVPAVATLRQQGYDVTQQTDVESLDDLCSGRYHVIFFDVRGVGEKLGKNGLDILRFVAEHNSLIYRVAYSARPFEASETDFLAKYADRSVKKDLTIVEFIDVIEGYAATLSSADVMARIRESLTLTWLQRYKLRHGWRFGDTDLHRIAKASGMAADSITVVKNVVTVGQALWAIASV